MTKRRAKERYDWLTPAVTIVVVLILALWLQSCIENEKQSCRERGGEPVVDYQRNVVCIQEGLR